MGEKGEGFTETIIKDTWTITREGGGNEGRRSGGLGWWGRVRGRGGRQKTVLEQQQQKISYTSPQTSWVGTYSGPRQSLHIHLAVLFMADAVNCAPSIRSPLHYRENSCAVWYTSIPS